MSSSKSLHVFGKKYRLERRSGLNKKGLDGECDTETHQILVDSKLKGDSYKEAVLHELFHAVIHECSINQAISHDLEEVIVDTLSRSVVKNFSIRHKSNKRSG